MWPLKKNRNLFLQNETWLFYLLIIAMNKVGIYFQTQIFFIKRKSKLLKIWFKLITSLLFVGNKYNRFFFNSIKLNTLSFYVFYFKLKPL